MTEAIRAPEVSEAASRVAADPAVRAALVAQQRAHPRRRRLGRRGARHRHRRRARRRGQGLPHRRARGARAPPRRRARQRRRASCCASRRCATSATARRDALAAAPAPDAVPVDTTGLALDEVVDQIVTLAVEAKEIGGREEGRRRRLPERRQVLAGQPPHAVARGGRARARPGSRATARSSPTDWNGRQFTLIDTGGVDLERRATRSPSRSRTRRARRSPTPRSRCSSSTRAPGCARATRSSPTSCAAAACRSSSPPTRSTRRATSRSPHEFHGLGLGEPMPVSAAQGLGTGDLLDRARRAAARRGRRADEDDDDVVRLAVIGRPNVGKSSLVNAFLGRERVIVSDVAGTTRDAIDTPIEVDGRRAAAGRHRRHPPRGQGRRSRSSTTRRCAPSARPSAPTSRSSSATPPTASPRRTCGSPSWR